ncbi:MAG: S9 family peptidase [Sulfolobaceae archaeon]|jgi:dipeptidyl aminopeptidase/acylaminoacyl peptidase|nr:S9 family peptidase [Sulfolobaceae archaeon]
MEYLELLKKLEELIKAPSYLIVGKLKDIPLLWTSTEGVFNLSVLRGDKLDRITKDPIVGLANPKSQLDYVPIIRDVEKGKELHSIFVVNLKGEEYELASPKVRITSIAYDEKSVVFTGSSQDSTALYIVEDGKLRKIVDIPPISAITDVDGDYIAGFGVFTKYFRSSEIFLADKSGEVKVITPKEGSVNITNILKEGKLYFTSDYEYSGEREWIYTYDVKSGEIRRVKFAYDDLEKSQPTSLSIDPDDKLVIASKNGESKLYINGKEIKTPEGNVTGATKVGDQVYFTHTHLLRKSAMYLYDLRDSTTRVVINSSVSIKGKVEFLKVKNGDVEVPTFIITPENKKDIGVIYVHGGPWSSVDNSWDTFIASLLINGYIVIAPNFRGSTGYGNKFMLMDIGDIGGGDLSDVVRVRDYVIEKKVVNKVGIMGYSYGGYMTLLALGKEPDKWDFGIAGAAIADWVEMYELGDSLSKGFIIMAFNGDNKELMKERSPITYVENVKAPLCIIQSQNDSRTPALPILKYSLRLQELGKKFELHLIPDMGHIPYTMDDMMKVVLPVVLFLERETKKEKS